MMILFLLPPNPTVRPIKKKKKGKKFSAQNLKFQPIDDD